jgi:nucleotide-binding universal stress UspA family protein
VALVAPGPTAAAVVRRAAEFATVDGAVPTLLTVRPPGDDWSDPTRDGERFVAEIAETAGLAPDEYETRVVVDDDPEAAILAAIDEYDTVCVGLADLSDRLGVPAGEITDDVARESRGNVALIRGS